MFEPLLEQELAVLRRMVLMFHHDGATLAWHTRAKVLAMDVRSEPFVSAVVNSGYVELRGHGPQAQIRLRPGFLGAAMVHALTGADVGRARSEWVTGMLRTQLPALRRHDQVGAFATSLCVVEPARPAGQLFELAAQLSTQFEPRAALILLDSFSSHVEHADEAVTALKVLL